MDEGGHITIVLIYYQHSCLDFDCDIDDDSNGPTASDQDVSKEPDPAL